MTNSTASPPTQSPRAAASTVARVAGLGHRFKEVEALREIDWSLAAGRLTALVGANGAGKSTLLGVLSGRLRPTSGTVHLFERPPRPRSLEFRRRISFTAQRPALDPEMTGREILRLFALLGGHSAERPGSGALIEGLGLSDHLDRPVKGYSGGLRQRLHLAIDAGRRTDLQLWDEPTSALDPRGRKHLWKHFVEAARCGAAVVVASHDLAAVEEHADEVLLLHRGRQLIAGAPRRLIEQHGLETLTFEVPSAPQGIAPSPAALPGVVTFEWSPQALQIAGRDGTSLEGQVARWLQGQGLRAQEVRRRQPDLASVYFHLSSQTLDRSPARRGKGGR